MSYMMICFVEECTDQSYAGTMEIIAAYARSDNAGRAGYLDGLRRRAGLDVRGASFHVLLPDKVDRTLTAEALLSVDDEFARVHVDNELGTHLKRTLDELMSRSSTGRMWLLIEWNGSSTTPVGPPVPHDRMSPAELHRGIDDGLVREDVLYLVEIIG